MTRSSRRLRRTILAALTAAIVLAVGACGGGQEPAAGSGGAGAGKQLKVVATTTQIADFVRNVGADGVQVTQIIQPNTDAHEYEPRPNDVESTAGADIVFENGDNLDAWMGKLVEESGAKASVVDLGAVVPVKVPGEAEGPEASQYDPHWWHDPVNAAAAVEKIRDTLAGAEPARAEAFRANAAAYLAKLEALQDGIAGCFAPIAPSKRLLVTSHDAFNYFAKRFGITVVGAVIPSQTTEAQPSSKELVELAKLVRDKHVAAVFPEESLNPALAKRIAEETGARADLVLYGDSLGPAGSAGDTYLKMEQANADAMATAFSGGKSSCTIPGIE
jgi:ABC-type Zn uptake system ZnuABC Zn-binding protein ZnuA